MNAQVRILGSGTSTGVPMLACKCETCTSEDPRDNRDRASMMLSHHGKNVVVDTTPEFRHQMLRASVENVDAVLLTHHHADHVHGFDDLRQFTFKSEYAVPVFGPPGTIAWLRDHFSYIWNAPQVGGGLPKVDVTAVEEAFVAAGVRIQPIAVQHGVMEVYGYRTGNFAYISDVSHIGPVAREALVNLDVLVVDALRYRSHTTHFNLDEAIATARELNVKQTYLTHLSHAFRHQRLAAELPSGITPAYDGLTFNIDAELV